MVSVQTFISNLHAGDATAVMQAFTLFNHVKLLEIKRTPLSASRLVARSLQSLEDIRLVLLQAEVNPEFDSFERQSIGMQLDSLGTLVHLQHLQLSWNSNTAESELWKDFFLGAFVGCSALENLKSLNCGVVCGTIQRYRPVCSDTCCHVDSTRQLEVCLPTSMAETETLAQTRRDCP